jgi:outer membrane protein assembly factor BamB
VRTPWTWALLFGMAVLAGCGSSSKKELPPADLPDFEAELTLRKEWSRSIGDGQGDLFNRLTPAVDGERIFAADADGLVQAMDRLTGKVLWKKKLKLPVSGGVGAGHGLVLVGTLKGEVIALDAESGEQRWQAKATSEVLSAPATNGDVVVQTQDDRLIGLDAATGAQRWIHESSPAVLTLRGTGAPLLTNDLAIAGLSNGKVIAVDARRGLPVWEQRVAVPQGRSELERIIDIDGGLLLSGSTVYVVSYQGRLAALDLNSGRVLWQREASSSVGVAQGFGSVYVSLANGTVEGIDERSTTALWSNDQLARRQLSAPEVFSSYVALGDYEGYLHLVSQVDGRFVARTRVDSDGLRARPIAVGGWLYVYGDGGKLMALTIK